MRCQTTSETTLFFYVQHNSRVPKSAAICALLSPVTAISGNGAAIVPTPPGFAEMVSDDSHYFMESLPFSSRDEFPTPRNLSACFSGLIDRQAHGQYHKTLCPSP